LGPVLYKTVETFQKVLVLIGVPFIMVLSIVLAAPADWSALANGLVGKGDGFWFLPAGISLAAFLAALAYSGAAGNLNLAQSFYIKEKGFGMGKYAGRITSLLTGAKQNVALEGAQFAVTPKNVAGFRRWWRVINAEHFLVFWLTGSIAIVLLSLLAYTTVYKVGGFDASIGFVINEGAVIGQRLWPIVGTFFLIVAGLTLFGTQLTVFDATSRILSENVVLAAPRRLSGRHIRPTYYLVLWLQILAGVAILLAGFDQPLQLLTLAAVMNAFAMFVHSGLTLWLNKTLLPEPLRPSRFRTTAMLLAFVSYGSFSIYVIWVELSKLL
jgi:hypothetical protein